MSDGLDGPDLTTLFFYNLDIQPVLCSTRSTNSDDKSVFFEMICILLHQIYGACSTMYLSMRGTQTYCAYCAHTGCMCDTSQQVYCILQALLLIIQPCIGYVCPYALARFGENLHSKYIQLPDLALSATAKGAIPQLM